MNTDITFCGHEECPIKWCARHFSNVPPNTPVSVATSDCHFLPMDDGDDYAKVARCKNCKYNKEV